MTHPIRPCCLPCALSAVLLVALSGCGKKDVVATVGSASVTRADVALYRATQRKNDAVAALDAVVARELLAEAARRDGLSKEPAVRARLAAAEREVLAQAYLDRELAAATSEGALRKRYDAARERLTRRRIHVAQIFVRPAGTSAEARAEAQSRATQAYARLLGGADFAALAREVSDDRLSAARGGDLGPVLEGEVDGRFFEGAAAVKADQVSKPFESGLGFHVVRALEGPVPVTPTFEEARGRLAAELMRERQEQLGAELERKVGVEKHPEKLGLDADPAIAPAGRDR